MSLKSEVIELLSDGREPEEIWQIMRDRYQVRSVTWSYISRIIREQNHDPIDPHQR